MPTVSIIIPCYNQGEYIQEVLLSVKNQTFDNFEVIIINDGSTDEKTVKILQNLNHPKTQVIHTPNRGLATARNTGIEASKGEYILPLDADDKIGTSYLESAITLFKKHKKLAVVYCNAEFFGAKKGRWILPEYSFSGMLKQNLIFCSAIYKRCDYDKTEGYNSNMKYGWEDWDFWLQLLKNGGDVYKIPEILFFYRIKKESMVRKIEKETYKRQYLEKQLIANHIKLYEKYFPEPLSMLRELDWLRQEKNAFEKYKRQIYNSLSYRIGDLLLKPFKMLRKKQ